MFVVGPSGSDANSCTSTAPCATLDHAYHLAKPGNTVTVTTGTYSTQTLTYDATKVGASSDVVFKAAPGALAILGGLIVDGASHVSIIGGSNGDLSSPTSGLTLSPHPLTMNSGRDLTFQNCASYVTAKNLDMRGFFVNGSDHVVISGGTVGGVDNAQANPLITGPYQGRGTSYCSAEEPYAINISNVLFHDVLRTNFPQGHPDCLQISGTTGTVLDGNHFIRCGTADVLARPAPGIWSSNVIDNLVIQNNALTAPVEGWNVLYLGGPTDACGSVAVINNISNSDLSSFVCGSYASLRVVGNAMSSMSAYSCRLVTARPGVVFDQNSVAVGPSCGTNGRVG